jgi:hypothetical protein
MLQLMALTACNSSAPNMVAIDTDSSTKSDTQKKDSHPNDRFRRELNTQMKGKDSLTMDSILLVLDKNGLTFCQYIQRLMQVDDSCSAISKRKFRDPLQQQELSSYVTKAVDKAEISYSKSLGMSKHSMEIAEAVYAFDTTARRICGNFPSYESKY